MITGANRGLGLEFARQYAAEGWRVIGTCRDMEKAGALRALGSGVEVVQLNVADRAAVFALSKKLADETLDVFIANAGVLPVPPSTKPEEIGEAPWLSAFRVNTMAPLDCASAFVQQVARSRERKMLVMGSWIGSIGSNTTGGHYVYRASKSALNAVWRSFAIDHPEVIAAVLSPGALRTDLTRFDEDWWSRLPHPSENIARLRAVIASLTQADSGGFFHFTGERLPW